MVGGAWDIVGFGDVAVVTLVDAVESEKIGSRTCSGSGVLVMPGHCRGVVTEGDNGATPTVDCLSNDVLLGNESSKLQVGVGDVTKGIVKGDEPS